MFKGYALFIILSFLLVGCEVLEKENPLKDTTFTIKSYNLSEKERLLINKTDVSQIEFFKLNGFLKEEEDLQFSVEVYENGILKNELLKTNGEIQRNYKDSLISFGISTMVEKKLHNKEKILSFVHIIDKIIR